MSDPWKHRSEGMKCKTCMWFALKQIEISEESIEVEPEILKPGKVIYTNVPAPPEPIIGRCRRHAPTMNGYPVVFVDDWCGDHKLNENTIRETP